MYNLLHKYQVVVFNFQYYKESLGILVFNVLTDYSYIKYEVYDFIMVFPDFKVLKILSSNHKC